MNSGLPTPTEKEWLEMDIISLFLRGFFLLIGLAGITTSLGLVAYEVIKDIPSASKATTAGATIGCFIPAVLMLLSIGSISLWRRIR